jgi:hypothetical protein
MILASLLGVGLITETFSCIEKDEPQRACDLVLVASLSKSHASVLATLGSRLPIEEHFHDIKQIHPVNAVQAVAAQLEFIVFGMVTVALSVVSDHVTQHVRPSLVLLSPELSGAIAVDQLLHFGKRDQLNRLKLRLVVRVAPTYHFDCKLA